MSPIIKRYGVCLLIFISVVLYIFYSHIGHKYIASESAYDNIEIGYTKQGPDDDDDIHVKSEHLVNLRNFQYKTVPVFCTDNQKRKLLGIIIVTTYVGHDEIRSAHRYAISQETLSDLGFQRVFLLAEIPWHDKFITQQAIDNENNRFNDIVQGNFIDAYRNLTYKHIMGLKWASSQACLDNVFIIKMDDDIVVDFFFLSTYLQNIVKDVGQKQYHLAGYVLRDVKPYRIRQNKWFVSIDEFDGDVYPDYLSGWMYVTTPALARRFVYAATTGDVKFFWIDDAWITGVLRSHQQIGINETWNSLYSANSQFIDCCIDDIKKYRYRCPFIAGPNGGDHKLIIKFLQSLQKQCYIVDKNPNVPIKNKCEHRPSEKPPLIKTCVGVDKHLIMEGHGAASINAIKL